jgi:hypothetical protein
VQQRSVKLRPHFEAYTTPRGLELVCTCRKGFDRRRVRISATGLKRLVQRRGCPPELELEL